MNPRPTNKVLFLETMDKDMPQATRAHLVDLGKQVGVDVRFVLLPLGLVTAHGTRAQQEAFLRLLEEDGAYTDQVEGSQ